MKKPSRRVAPYKNPALPIEQRVADLLGRMTLTEKIGQVSSESKGVPRLGIPAFAWGGECLHGLVHTGRATVFPASIAMAATFNPDLVRRVADSIATEARAKYHDPLWHGPNGPRVSINFWTPNINIVRDPRWGRGQETYGEDPYLTGVIGSAFVRGLQGDHPKYLKAGACAKHLAAHSGPDAQQQTFDAVVSRKDLFETYLPAFRALVAAGASTVMATYNRLNGEPCCGSDFLLGHVLRELWGFAGFITSDGGAIDAIHQHHKFTRGPLESAVLCMNAGCDMEIGTSYKELPEAIRRGLVTEAQIDRSVARILTAQFRLGLLDSPREVPYAKIRADVIQCPEHIKQARETAQQSLVLLKNNGILPLGRQTQTILVTGPNAADEQVLLGNFYRGVSANLKTILEGIVERAPQGVAVTHMQGCFAERPNIFPSDWHEGLAKWADAVVAVVGVTPLMEGESGECIASRDGADRDDIALPPHQVQFLRGLKAKGKPLIVIVTGGAAIAMPEVHELADAVLLAWYPGEQGGLAVGDVLFGHHSPAGRLPVTFPMSTAQLPPYDDYSMAGRTYRFMDAQPLYPFGFGLSYTRFSYGPCKLSAKRIAPGQSVRAEVTVTNTGKRPADEVVQLYITDDAASTRVPRCALKGFRRIRLAPGRAKLVRFTITPEMMEVIHDDGKPVLEPGTFTVTIGGASPGPRGTALGAPKPAVAKFTVK